MRDSILTASFMIHEITGLIVAFDVAELFAFDDGTVRYTIKGHPEFYEIVRRFPIIAKPTRLLIAIGPGFVGHYGPVLKRQVDQTFLKLQHQLHDNPSKIYQYKEERMTLCLAFLDYWGDKLNHPLS